MEGVWRGRGVAEPTEAESWESTTQVWPTEAESHGTLGGFTPMSLYCWLGEVYPQITNPDVYKPMGCTVRYPTGHSMGYCVLLLRDRGWSKFCNRKSISLRGAPRPEKPPLSRTGGLCDCTYIHISIYPYIQISMYYIYGYIAEN